MKRYSRRDLLKTALVSASGLMLAQHMDPVRAAQDAAGERWAVSANLNIVVYSPDGAIQRLTTDGNDFKPSWSPDGSMLTFFRATQYGASFKNWRSKICVINADGTGFRELTTADCPNFNPTWTRDGTNRIVFNRYSPNGRDRNLVISIAPDAEIGDETQLSNPGIYYEWVNSGLQDGRLIVDRITDQRFQSFLLTPNGSQPTYEKIERPTTLFWHKLSVSPSETRVAYMLDNNNDIPTYQDSVICFADFDLENLRIHNQVQITPEDTSSVQEYPTWNRDESLLVYDSNESGTYQTYAYDMASGETTRHSFYEVISDQFACFEGLPK